MYDVDARKGYDKKQIEKELARQAVLFEEKCKDGYQNTAIKFQAFAEEWLEVYAKQNLRNTTYEEALKLRGRIFKAIGHMRLDKLTTRQIQAFINTLSKDGANLINGKPLSPKTVRHYLNFISDVFNYGIRMGIISNNPCRNVCLPKIEHKEKQIYTVTEVNKFLTLLADEPLKYRTFFNLAVYSGFRRGELLGLEWKDIDFENNIISVRRTSCYTKSRGIYTDTTKTCKSQRTMKFPQEIMDLLKQLRDEQDGEALKMGDHWVDTDRLFTKDNGEPQHPNTTYTWLKRFCNGNDLPFYGIHQFRHLFASCLVNEGVDIVSVSGALGHSTVSTTSNIYCHYLEISRARVSEAISNALKFGA